MGCGFCSGTEPPAQCQALGSILAAVTSFDCHDFLSCIIPVGWKKKAGDQRHLRNDSHTEEKGKSFISVGGSGPAVPGLPPLGSGPSGVFARGAFL